MKVYVLMITIVHASCKSFT